jgi:hypothetical protein
MVIDVAVVTAAQLIQVYKDIAQWICQYADSLQQRVMKP